MNSKKRNSKECKITFFLDFLPDKYLNGKPVDSILDAVFTVSPNKQYLGILSPTTPATQGPEMI